MLLVLLHRLYFYTSESLKDMLTITLSSLDCRRFNNNLSLAPKTFTMTINFYVFFVNMLLYGLAMLSL